MNTKDSERTEVTNEHILTALIDESVRSRLRHRTLLRLLVESGVVQQSTYVAMYQAEEEANFGTLLDMLLMDPVDFRQRHDAWFEKERERLGYNADVVPGVQLTAKESDDDALGTIDEVVKSKKKKPQAKAQRK